MYDQVARMTVKSAKVIISELLSLSLRILLISEISQTVYLLPKHQGTNSTRFSRCLPETADEDEMMLWPNRS